VPDELSAARKAARSVKMVISACAAAAHSSAAAKDKDLSDSDFGFTVALPRRGQVEPAIKASSA
jgi:hypothetical protein